jgi:hypothetical protein
VGEPASAHESELRGGLLGLGFQARSAGSLMMVSAGLIGLADAPDTLNEIPNGSAAVMTEASSRSRWFASWSMKSSPLLERAAGSPRR